MIAAFFTYLGCAVLLLGASFALLAAIGVLRLPDLYTRMHAASKAGAVGGGLILLAVALISFDGAVALRAILGTGFLLLTTPVSAHLLARVHHSSKDHNAVNMISDELTSQRSPNPPA
ncbi:monovalent cation/H(+) antiporter subunit G [Devosia beringensis]|uniref:monovalent cation/H(+) antiporter subunit G n=1 Tax=Devosia beringensis TaxID=2657486 RepID=UPI00186B9BC2|nr:monovalent cation/H(+) antiporter subunit G [Devosia beringensis]